MAFFGFMKNFGKQKVQQAGQSLVQMLASWDPESASAAEIEQMEERLDKLTQQVAQARQAYQKEQKEADEIQALYEQRMKAAEILQQRLTEGGGADVEEALGELVAELEDMQPELEREMEEAEEAKKFMQELEDVAKTAAEKLRTARKTLEGAKREMQRAKIREERAKDKAEQSAVVAGLRQETDQLGSALSAFQKEADEANAKADAYNMKSKLLAPSSKETSNSLIADAMSQAKGGAAKPSNITDRLAALKKK